MVGYDWSDFPATVCRYVLSQKGVDKEITLPTKTVLQFIMVEFGCKRSIARGRLLQLVKEIDELTYIKAPTNIAWRDTRYGSYITMSPKDGTEHWDKPHYNDGRQYVRL